MIFFAEWAFFHVPMAESTLVYEKIIKNMEKVQKHGLMVICTLENLRIT